MTFDAYDRSLELLRELVPVLQRLAAVDGDLAGQARRAATSVALNVAEGNRRTLKDRRNRFRIALGSAAEVASCLRRGGPRLRRRGDGGTAPSAARPREGDDLPALAVGRPGPAVRAVRS